MPPLTLEGENLGSKHKIFNKLVNKTVKGNTPFEELKNDPIVTDIDALYKIDVACKYKNVDFILETFKSDDMLHVSRAIKNSSWMFSDKQYANIINPENLLNNVFPQMTSKAICKLILNIRLHLKDETRVEQFYKYYEEKDDIKTALKWLPGCSISFIEKAVEKHTWTINVNIFKRLCEKSFTALDSLVKTDNNNYQIEKYLNAVKFLLNTDTEKYLDIVEKLENYYQPNLGSKGTTIVLKKCPDRILDNFDKYKSITNMDSIGKYLKGDKVKDFILKLANNKIIDYWFTYDKIKPLIKYMVKDGKFEFLKQLFIDKSHPKNKGDADLVAKCSYTMSYSSPANSSNIYLWYHHAPFHVAFPDLKKLIRTESTPDERTAILKVLIACAGKNLNHIQTLLQYFHDKHMNEPIKFKENFINTLLSTNNSHKYNEKCWILLDEIFHSMEVYIDNDNNLQKCFQAIIIRKVLLDQPIPEVIEKKFKLCTLSYMRNKLQAIEQEKMFSCLYGIMIRKINKESLNELEGAIKVISILSQMIYLLVEWKKELKDNALILEKIKEVVQIKNDRKWNLTLDQLYENKGSWRRSVFEESLLLVQNEDVVINVLKHQPDLLSQHLTQLNVLRWNDTKNLDRLLKKVRIYWPESLYVQWMDDYNKRLEVCRTEPAGHRAVARGLCMLLPSDKLERTLRDYAPTNYKIHWSEEDPAVLSLRKNFAQLMHKARPSPPPSLLMLYAQGDYLQYALPSLVAIYYNMSAQKCRSHIKEILSGPVSLQKHGMRVAFNKLQPEELSPILLEIWKNTKNSTIRSVAFQLVFSLLTKEKNQNKIEEFWKLLCIFIDNLSTEENKNIYLKLEKVSEVPLSVRPQFFMKAYKFLKSLPAKANCESLTYSIIRYAPEFVDKLDSEFVDEILLEYIDKEYVNKKILKENNNYGYILDLIAAYSLCTTDEDTQMKIYEKIFKPILNYSTEMWTETILYNTHNKDYTVKNRFDSLITSLLIRLYRNFLNKNNYNVPIKLFKQMNCDFGSNLTVVKAYPIVTLLKLAAALSESYDKFKSTLKKFDVIIDCNNAFCNAETSEVEKEFWTKLSPSFAASCIEILKEDIKNYFPSIQTLFAAELVSFMSKLSVHKVGYSQLAMSLIEDMSYVPGCLLSLSIVPNYYSNSDRESFHEFQRKVYLHPSEEVKMHYHGKYYDEPIPL